MKQCLLRHRCAWLLLLATGLGPLAVAYFTQWVLAMHPCHLCLWQRVPYALIALLGVIAFIMRDRPALIRRVAWLAVLLLVINLALAAYHVGVERHWIQGPEGCTASSAAGLTLEELKAQIEGAPAVRCDETQPFLGSTMPVWNLGLLIVLSAAGVGYARRSGKGTPP